MVANTPLDCQICQKHNCLFIKQHIDDPVYNDQGQLVFIAQSNVNIEVNESDINSTTTTSPIEPIDINNDKDYSAWWVKKYCTETAVDGFIKYFPYILFVVALVIVAIEKLFTKTFKAGKKLNAFYNLLVKEEEVGDDNKELMNCDGQTIDDRKDIIEISHSFTTQDNFLLSYLLRTVVELFFAIFLMIWICGYGLPVMFYEDLISCNVYGKMYECAGHPQMFFMYILGITIVILIFYIICCVYNVLWLAFPNIRGLGRLMIEYSKATQSQNNKRTSDKTKKKTKGVLNEKDEENGVVLEDSENCEDEEYEGDNLDLFYFNNPDLKLLLDLLAVASGIPHSLRILVLFDRSFRLRFQPGPFQFSNLYYHDCNGKINIAEKDSGMSVEEKRKNVFNVTLEFKEAVAISKVFGKRKDLSCIYTVEILPRTARSSITTAINLGNRGGKWALEEMRRHKLESQSTPITKEKEIEQVSQPPSVFSNWKVRLYDLEIEKEYTIRASTIINGRSIAQRIEKLKAKDVDHECKILECRRIHMFQE